MNRKKVFFPSLEEREGDHRFRSSLPASALHFVFYQPFEQYLDVNTLESSGVSLSLAGVSVIREHRNDRDRASYSSDTKNENGRKF